MSDIICAAMQCDSTLKLIALVVVCLVVVCAVIAYIASIVKFVVAKALNTIVTYHSVSIRIGSDSVNVESDLNR